MSEKHSKMLRLHEIDSDTFELLSVSYNPDSTTSVNYEITKGMTTLQVLDAIKLAVGVVDVEVKNRAYNPYFHRSPSDLGRGFPAYLSCSGAYDNWNLTLVVDWKEVPK